MLTKSWWTGCWIRPTTAKRMASEWLDVARYADSHGYQDDGMRNMWPWRGLGH